MIIRIDARKMADAANMHAALSDAFGFFSGYGKNLDALIDCLSSLDDPKAGLSSVQLFPGEILLLVIENVSKKSAAQVKSLTDAVAFVNWRRWERGQKPVIALAYEGD
jgi:hypothetical protein